MYSQILSAIPPYPWLFIIILIISELIVRHLTSPITVRKQSCFDPDGVGRSTDEQENKYRKETRQTLRMTFYSLTALAFLVVWAMG